MFQRFSLIVFAFAAACAAGETPLWEPGRVVSVEPVSTPPKTPDPICHSVPRGSEPPPQCRPANLRAESFWRVTVEAGNKRFVVRPYRDPGLLGAFSQDIVYVDPKLTPSSSIEIAVVSSKTIRLRTDQGPGLPAALESQALILRAEMPTAPAPVAAPATPQSVAPAIAQPALAQPLGVTAGSKVVLLENGNFADLEVKEAAIQDIGGGATLYSFDGDTSRTRSASNPPVFLMLADNEAAMGGTSELSRLQVSKGARQLVYSRSTQRSASPVAIEVTQVSATVRRISIKQALPPGEYVILMGNSTRGFLFGVP